MFPSIKHYVLLQFGLGLAWIRIIGGITIRKSTPPPLTRVTIALMTEKKVYLYRRFSPPGRIIPVELDQFSVDDLVPDYKEVDRAVFCLHLNRVGGPSIMTVVNIWDWFHSATW